MDSVFDKFDDEEADEQPRKRKLVPLDYDDDKSLGVDGAGLANIKGANSEEKRKHIKSLIEKIPTEKPELFSYSLDWTMVDTVRRKTCFEALCSLSWNVCEMESCSESVSRYCFPPNLSSQLFFPQTLMERRVRPWINKKIIEYIGEEEATLVDFVCSKVLTLWEQLFIPLLKRWGK